MIGWEKRVSEPANGLVIPPASGVNDGWVTLATWDRAEAVELGLIGPAELYGHVGADLGDASLAGAKRIATFPLDVKTQWLRSSGDGLTQRQSHPVGRSWRWATGVGGPEYLTLDDFPLRFQVWHEGGVMVVRKVITVIDAPDSRIAARIAP